MSDWEWRTLGDIASSQGYGLVDGPFGSNLPASCYVESGIPVIRGSNLTLGTDRFVANEFVYVSEETASQLERSLARPSDIVFTKKGTIGQTGLIPNNLPYDVYLISSNQMKLTVDESVADPIFVYYYVSSKESQNKIKRDSEFTGVPKTNTKYLREFPIYLPPLQQQKQIAKTLDSLDRKIENLRKQNETLERIAQTLFKRWFVDFEFPNEDGKPYKSSGGAMERSELGDIPVGWRVGKLENFGKVITGKTPSTQNPDYWNNGLPFITPTDFKNYGKFVLNSERKISNLAVVEFKNLIIPEKSVVVTCIGSDMGKVAITATRCVTNQQLNSLVFDKIKNGIEYVYQFLVSQYKMLRLMALGGSTMPIINKTVFSNIEIVIPDFFTLDKFNEIVEPFNLKVINNQQQIQTLTKTRDVLLPKLMSGKLRITE